MDYVLSRSMHDHVRWNLCLALLCLAATVCCGKRVCTFTGLADTAGNNDDWRDYKFMANPDNCKEICSSESWCTAAEFDFYSRSCYLFKGDTPLSHKKDSVFMKKVCTEVTTTSPATESTAPESKTRMSASTESTTLTQRMFKKDRPSSKKKGSKPVSLRVKMLHRNSQGDRMTPTVAFTTTTAPTTPITTSSSTKKLQMSTTSRPVKRARKRIYSKKSRKRQTSRKQKKSRRVKKIRRIIKSRRPTQPPKTVFKKTPVPKITISYNTRKRSPLSKLTQKRKSISGASTTTPVPFIDLNIDSSSQEIRLKAKNETERKQKSTYQMPVIRLRTKVSVNPLARDANKVDASRPYHSRMTSATYPCFNRCPSTLQWYTRNGQVVPFTRRTYFQPLYRIRIPIRLRVSAFQQAHSVQTPQMIGKKHFQNANQNPRQVACKNTTQHQVQKPATKAGKNPGQIPGKNPGHNPGKNPGHYPVKNPGHSPGKNPGHYPVKNPGHNPGKNPGHYPVKKPGHNPGKNPGHYPVKKPGHNPGKNPEHYPVKKPGHYPVKKSGQNPVHNPGHYPVQNPGHYPIQNSMRYSVRYPVYNPVHYPAVLQYWRQRIPPVYFNSGYSPRRAATAYYTPQRNPWANNFQKARLAPKKTHHVAVIPGGLYKPVPTRRRVYKQPYTYKPKPPTTQSPMPPKQDVKTTEEAKKIQKSPPKPRQVKTYQKSHVLRVKEKPKKDDSSTPQNDQHRQFKPHYNSYTLRLRLRKPISGYKRCYLRQQLPAPPKILVVSFKVDGSFNAKSLPVTYPRRICAFIQPGRRYPEFRLPSPLVIFTGTSYIRNPDEIRKIYAATAPKAEYNVKSIQQKTSLNRYTAVYNSPPIFRQLKEPVEISSAVVSFDMTRMGFLYHFTVRLPMTLRSRNIMVEDYMSRDITSLKVHPQPFVRRG